MASRRAIIVVDLAFGDCGKGSVVDYLVRRFDAKVVARFNGGPQAGHNVVTPDGRHHTFSHFGSGTLAGAATVLSRFVLIEPYALLNEAAHLREVGVADPCAGVWIDQRCIVITPIHQAANRLRELMRGSQAHGTCGQGVGEAVSDAIRYPHLTLTAGELGDCDGVARKLRELAACKREELAAVAGAGRDWETLADAGWIDVAIENYRGVADSVRIVAPQEIARMLRTAESLVCEGAQGALLDERYGFHPHTTWSTTTAANALRLLNECDFAGDRMRLGVLRSYFTRHGRGPFVTEDVAMKLSLPEPHNGDDGCAGVFRVGPFDTVAARYAVRCNVGIDGLALTHLDHLKHLPAQICTAYELHIADRDLFSGDGDDMRMAATMAEQEKLTMALWRCRPRMTAVATHDREAFIRMVEQQLGRVVVLRSWGATYRDKEMAM